MSIDKISINDTPQGAIHQLRGQTKERDMKDISEHNFTGFHSCNNIISMGQTEVVAVVKLCVCVGGSQPMKSAMNRNRN